MKSDIVDYTVVEKQLDGADCLFRVMMRLEFALKKRKFLRRNRRYADVDWKKFAKHLGKPFFEEVKKSHIAHDLIHSPPNRQIVNDTRDLDWEPATEVSDIKGLIFALRRVRNNLFHGAKSDDSGGERNVALIHNALCVIDYILQYDDKLRKIFEENN